MDPQGSLSCLQEPATGPYPEQDKCYQHPQTLFSRDTF
jgi:hypothetical protein